MQDEPDAVCDAPTAPGAATSGRNGALPWASLLFFLSGAVGLGYEVIWFKRFSHVWGNSTLAMAAVVGSFLLGLGLGAHLFGRLADRVRLPLLWYGFCEGAIGVFALLIPLEIRWLQQLTGAFYPSLESSPLLLSCVKLMLTFLVLAPPCLCMGGSVPLVLKQFAPSGSFVKERVGWLYATNTLGASAGCCLTGFYFLPWLGLYQWNLVLVIASLAIGGVAAAVAVRVGEPITPHPPSEAAWRPANAPPDGLPGLAPLFAAAVLTGAGALILEVVWTRQLALVLGGSTYAFTAMLSLFLAGIGLGSLLFHLALARSPSLGTAAATWVILGLVVTAVLGKEMIPALAEVVGMLGPLRASQIQNAAVCLAASAVVEFLPTVGMGLLFPLLTHLVSCRSAATGRAAGNIYALNIAGSIIGAAATPLLLIPAIGLARSVATALGLYSVTLVVLSPSPRGWRQRTTLFLACVGVIGSAAVAVRDVDPRLTNLGMYLYGHSSSTAFDSEIVFFEEGSSSNVLVTERQGMRVLRVNGKVDASSSGDMNMQLGLAYLPLLLRPDAGEVLVIGHGSGSTAGAALLFPGTRVTCCEVEPAVFRASKHFSGVNHEPERSPRFFPVVDDGRSYLEGTDRKFDIILSEPSNPWMAGVSSLFTREFYELAARKLARGGILAQWIQAYSFSPSDYALIVRTILDVFPEARLLRISDGDTILLASLSSLATSNDVMARVQSLVDSLSEVRSDLEKHLGWTDVRALLLTHMILDTGGLARLVRSDPSAVMNTDINMRLEFDAPRSLFETDDSQKDVNHSILASADVAWQVELAKQLGLSAAQAPAFHRLYAIFDAAEQAGAAQSIIELGLSLDPEDPALLADRLITSSDDDSTVMRETVATIARLSPEEAIRAAKDIFTRGRYERAVEVLLEILRIYPESVTAWTNLAVSYEELGNDALAVEAYEKALELDPFSYFARAAYDRFDRSEGTGENEE